jgi:hypothetical protein
MSRVLFISVTLIVPLRSGGTRAGNKITITTTHILLMAIAILLVTLLLENSEKPKRMVVVDKKKPAEKIAEKDL